MTTTTLSSKARFGSLLGGMLRKNRSAMFYIFVLTFFFFPLQYILETLRVERVHVDGVVNSSWSAYYNLVGPAKIHTAFSCVVVFLIFMGATVVIALAQASYLHNRRAVDVYHALPVTRGVLLTANASAAFLTVAIPMALNYLVILGYGGWRAATLLSLTPDTNFVFSVGAILMDLLGWLMTVLSIVAVTMLVATQVSSAFDNLIFMGEVIFAVPAVKLVLHILLGTLAGYCYEPTPRGMVCWSPALIMVGKYLDLANRSSYNILILVWLAVSVLLLWAAVLLYRRRPSEMSESVGRGGALVWFGKALAAFLGAAGMSLLLSSACNGSKVVFVLGAAVGAALLCLLLDAIINRGFKGLGKSLMTDGILCLVFTALAAALITGGAGFENRIPAASAVESASISYRGRYGYCTELDLSRYTEGRDYQNNRYYNYSAQEDVTFSSPESIERYILPLHRAMLESTRTQEYDRYQEIHITYRLKNGRTMERRYHNLTAESVSTLLELESDPEFYRQTNPVFAAAPEEIEQLSATDCQGFAVSALRDPAAIARVMEALRADLAADADPNSYALPAAYLTFDTGIDSAYTEYRVEKGRWCSFSVSVPADYTQTLAALRALTGREYQTAFADVTAVLVGDYEPYACSYNYAGFSRVATYYDMGMTQDEELYDKYLSGSSTVTDAAQVAELLRLAETATGLQRDGDQYIYITLVRRDALGETIGATLLVDYADVPEWAWDVIYYPGYYAENKEARG